MFYAAFERHGQRPEAYIYHENSAGYQAFIRDTWNPYTRIIDRFPLHISGSTYAERKEHARELAQRFQSADSDASGGGFSYGEYATMYEFFENAARRYGLIEEFRENCII